MANLLDRLAGRALGLVPVMQPIVPPITSAISSHKDVSTVEAPVKVAHRTEIAGSDVAETATHPSLPRPDDVATSQRLPAQSRPIILEQTVSHLSPAEHETPSRQAINTHSVHPRLESPGSQVSENKNRRDSEPEINVQPAIRTVSATSVVYSIAPPVKHVAEPILPVKPAPVVSGRSQSLSAPTDPVIRITIGRVDVRAQYPPSATPVPPPRHKGASPLSLEEYAKQRSEGRR